MSECARGGPDDSRSAPPWSAGDDALALAIHARVVHEVARVGGGMLALARSAGHRADVLTAALELDRTLPDHAFDAVPRRIVRARLTAAIGALAALDEPRRPAAVRAQRRRGG